MILIASAALIVVLAAVLFAPKQSAPLPAGQGTADGGITSTNPGRPIIVARKQFFSWDELESSDYQVYIARLREIGCPEQTIRDIIIADVNQLYSEKRLAEVTIPEQQWWRADPDTNLVQAANAKIQALDQERRALLTRLLGPNWESGDAARTPIPLNGPVLGELPSSTKQVVQAIVARSQQRTQAYAEAQQRAGKSTDPADLNRLEQMARQELAQVLTPAQLEEFLLRYSRSASDLRRLLKGFEVTPDEFRTMFRLTDPIEQQIQLSSGSDPSLVARREELAKQLQDTIRNVLGAGRYQAYQLSQDPAYREAMAVARQAGASPEVGQNLYRIKVAARQEADRINNDPALTADQKAEQIKALTQQQQTASDQLLGVAPPTPPMPAPPPLPTQVHAFAPGETIDMIAAKYGLSPTEIWNANPNLTASTPLQKGTPIIIPKKP